MWFLSESTILDRNNDDNQSDLLLAGNITNNLAIKNGNKKKT